MILVSEPHSPRMVMFIPEGKWQSAQFLSSQGASFHLRSMLVFAQFSASCPLGDPSSHRVSTEEQC